MTLHDLALLLLCIGMLSVAIGLAVLPRTHPREPATFVFTASGNMSEDEEEQIAAGIRRRFVAAGQPVPIVLFLVPTATLNRIR